MREYPAMRFAAAALTYLIVEIGYAISESFVDQTNTSDITDVIALAAGIIVYKRTTSMSVPEPSSKHASS